jgi:8-oxo-dGTP diphosphatase
VITCTFEDGGQARLRHVVLHAVVERNGALLLVKRAPHLSEGGKWGLPGGFLDRDETVADGVLRELLEETGWTGRVVTLLRVNSRPGRPREDRQNVALDFVIEPLEQRGAPDAESSDVQWIPIERVLSLDLAFDHGETVRSYFEFRRRQVTTPILI